MRGQGCPKCSKRYTNTKEEFLKELLVINPNISIISEYLKMSKKVRAKCLKDGYEWNVTPSRLLRGSGCPKCGGVAPYTSKEFSEKLKERNPDVEMVGEYINNKTKFQVRCINDGYIWMATPKTLLKGIGCPCCKISKGEKYLFLYLNKIDVKFISQYSFFDLLGNFNRSLKFDCAIFDQEELIYLIEIDGIGHRKPIKFNGMSDDDALEKFNLIKKYDQLKDEYCINKNIKLIRIEYDGKNFKEIPNILKEKYSFFRKEVI